MTKQCCVCPKQLVRKNGERPGIFARRTCCDSICRMVWMQSRSAAANAQKVTLPCDGCKKPQVRPSRTKRAVCAECIEKNRQRNWNAKRHENQEQARRYRVLMTTLGFESFDKCIAYLKTVPWTDFKEHLVRNLRSAA